MMRNQNHRVGSRRLCGSRFAFLRAMRFFAYRYFYRFYCFIRANAHAQRAVAAAMR